MSNDAPLPDASVPLTPANEPGSPAYVPDEYEAFEASPSATRRPDPPMTRSRLRMWLLIGGVLWALGLAGWLVLAVGGCEPDGDAGPPVKKRN